MSVGDVIGTAVEGAIESIAEPTDEQAAIATESETPPAQADDGAVKAAEPAANVEDDEAEIKKIEADLITKNPMIQKGRIPVHRHQAVVTRTRNKLQAQLDAKQAELDAKIKEFASPEHERRYKMLQVLEHDPDRGFAALMTNPRYRALVEAEAKKIGATVTPAGEVKPIAAPVVTDVPADMPKPDYLNPDGSVSYTPAQAAKLAAWQADQSVTKVSAQHKAEIEALRKDVAPIVDQRRAIEQLEAKKNELLPRLRQAIETWPGMKKYYQAFQEGIRQPENSQVGLEDGYRMFVVPLLAKEMADAEARVTAAKAEGHAAALKDVEQRIPKDSLRPVATARVGADATNGSFDMESVIRNSLAGLR
jgi:hypothetical protein